MISKLVRDYEEHQEKKMMQISMAAMVVQAKLLVIKEMDDPIEKEKQIKNAIDDLRYISNELTKNDFKGVL